MAAPPGSKRVFEQIEEKADFYSPVTYVGLLNFYNGFNVQPDAASGQFIPLTQVKPGAPTDRILFAVGILPPAANVTGRILDRTASLPTDGETELVGEQAAAAAPSSGAEPPGAVGKVTESRAAGSHKWGRQVMLEAFRELYGREPTLAELQYAQAVGWAETSYGQSWKREMIGSNNWGAVHCPLNGQTGPGCISYTDHHPDGTPFTVSFKSYETPKDGAKDLLRHIFTHRSTGQALQDGDTYRASYLMRRQSYYGGFCPQATKEFGAYAAKTSLKSPDASEGTQACAKEAIGLHAGRIHQIIQDIAVANGDPSVLGLGNYESADAWYRETRGLDSAGKPIGGDAGPGNWQAQGSKDAKDAKQEETQLAGSPLLASEANKALIAAQMVQARMTQEAIAKMAATPPLAMLVNPNSFGGKGDKIANDGSWTRNGPIVEFWGDQQDKISGSGKVAGFFALDATNATGPGLTRMARNLSQGWENFQSLYLLYRNNGALYLPDFVSREDRLNLAMVGSVYIYYDNTIYIGSFDSFNVTENDATPFTVEYSFEFTVRAAFLLDRTDDQFTYGAPNLFPKGAPIAAASPKNFEDQLVEQYQTDTLFGTPGDDAPSDFSTPE
jgi:hypothetical protein